MPTEEASWEVLAGDEVSASSTITIVDIGSVGTPAAFRTMTHPDSSNFPIVTYNLNPTRTINFDQQPLPVPSSSTFRTLGTTQPFVTQNALDDVVVTERWEANGGNVSMIASQFRRMYELIVNPPAAADPEVFLRWAPRDRSSSVYNVVLLDLRVGGTSGKLDVKEIGVFAAGTLDTVATGLIDRIVEWDFLLVSEV